MKTDILKLINDNKKLIYKIAGKYSFHYDIEDLYQVGIIGLMKAYKNYNSNLNAKFSTYAYSYIIGEILEFIKNDRNIKVNSDAIKIYKSYQKALEFLTHKYSKKPSFTEVCKFLEIPEDIVYNSLVSSEFTISLDNEINNIGSYYELLGEDNSDKLDDLICLRNEIAQLGNLEREIIKCRYYKDYTQNETANILGISQVQVSRYEKNILSRIKENMIC